MIKPETIDKIFDEARIEEVVGDFVILKRRGVNMLGLCPFHNEKTPSFTVSPAKGIFKCFGCGKGGNAVNFIMEHEHFSYPEALKYLAHKYNIEIEEEKPSEEQQQIIDEKESLYNVTAFAQQHYEKNLFETEEGKSVGLTYFKERGFSSETIKRFGLGYSLNSWDDFSSKALKHGYKKGMLEKSSLSRSKDQQLYDTFRNRVVFPIHSLGGRVLGFGARMLGQEKNKPKYINTAESEIYHKSKVLYGLYFAKTAIVREDNCYLTEGYTDVISLHQAGVENVIASSGTSLTTDQIKLIRRYTQNITLLFDGDAAGIKAAFRGIDMILQEGMNVRIVLFPEGEDPDSYARKYRPAEVLEFITQNAGDFITFKTNLLLQETQNDPIKKAGLIKEIAQSISLVPEPIARELYVQKSSRMMEIDEKLLLNEINKQIRFRTKKGDDSVSKKQEEEWVSQPEIADAGKITKGVVDEHQEKELIRVLMLYHDHDMILNAENEEGETVDVSMKVRDFIVNDLTEEEIRFESPLCEKIFQEFVGLKDNGEELTDRHFLQHSDPELSKLAVDVHSSPYELSEQWEHKHGIYVKKEEEDIQKAVVETLYAFKLKKVERIILTNMEAMKEEKDFEKLVELMNFARHYKDVKNAYARELSRVVTR